MIKDTRVAEFLFFLFCIPTWIVWYLPIAFILPRTVTGAIDASTALLFAFGAHLITCFVLNYLDERADIRNEKKSIEEAKIIQARLAKKKEWRPAQSKSNT